MVCDSLADRRATADAVRRARSAVKEAEAVGDDDALGSAYFVLGWASAMRGDNDAEPLYQRSLEAYRRSGNLMRQAVQLTNLGAVCCLEGRWDEADQVLRRWTRCIVEAGRYGQCGARQHQRVGNPGRPRRVCASGSASARDLCRPGRPRSTVITSGSAFCCSGGCRCGQVVSRQALQHLEQAKANYLAVGAEREVPALDARIAECRLCSGDVDGALDVVMTMLGKGESARRAYPLALLHRVHALALWKKGDMAGARSALEASIAAARNAKDFFELTLALLALIELDRQRGAESPPDARGGRSRR